MRKIFTLLILLLLLPVTALAAGDTAPQTLYVGSTTIGTGYWTSSDGGKVWTSQADEPEGNNYIYYDGQGTLKLHNATIQGGSTTESAPFGSGIYALSSSNQPVALTIELIGTNTITGDMGIYVAAEASATSYGTDASLAITSENNGSLQVSGLNYGIYVTSGTGNASLTINDASVVAKTTQTYSSFAGVYVQSSAHATSSPQLSLAVNGGSLTTSASKGNDGIQFYVGNSSASATTSLTVSENAIVDARNGGISALKITETLPTPTPTGDNRSGIVFDGKNGTVYGEVTLQENLTIGEGETLTIPEGSSLNASGKLTNEGTINVESGGNLEGEPTSGSGTVVNAPSIGTQPASQSVTEGGTAEFSVTATGKNLSYQWQQSTDNGQSWTDISEAKAATYTTVATTTDMSGTQYRCVVSNSAGSVTSNAATLTVEKKTVPVTGVTLNPTSLSLFTDGSETLTATVEPGNATNKAVTWSTSDNTVATVDENGTVTAVGAGEATITVTTEDGEKTATCTVTVTVPVTGVKLNKETLELFTDGSETLTATVEPGNATNKNVNWSSSDETIATVDNNGTVTAVGAGETTISVQTQDGNYTASCTVTVTKPEEPKPPIDQPSYYNIYVEDVCDGVEVTTSKNVVREGNSISVYVEKDTANYTFDNFKVYYKRSYYGPWEVLEEGVQPGEYPIKNIWTHIYIKAEGAEEKEDPTGIEQVEGVKVYTKDGSLYVQTPQREQVLVIGMTGAVVKNEEQVGLKQYHGLQPGIYIVRVGDKAYKLRLN